tara:strand:- start:138 stop:698 length:561 start_codon:yes stop_codon:yes gene_type:complete
MKNRLANYHEGIEIFDGVFSYSTREEMYKIARGSSYSIGWSDTEIIEHQDKVFLFSKLPKRWLEKKFMLEVERSGCETLKDRIRNSGSLLKGVINCGILSDSYLAHSHAGQNVLIYYANMDWKDCWNGETTFFTRDLKEIAFTNKYVPGRLVWFDGEIPHTIKPVSFSGPKFRFTYSIFFDKEKRR